jgi:hypothetical protein
MYKSFLGKAKFPWKRGPARGAAYAEDSRKISEKNFAASFFLRGRRKQFPGKFFPVKAARK